MSDHNWEFLGHEQISYDRLLFAALWFIKQNWNRSSDLLVNICV